MLITSQLKGNKFRMLTIKPVYFADSDKFLPLSEIQPRLSCS